MTKKSDTPSKQFSSSDLENFSKRLGDAKKKHEVPEYDNTEGSLLGMAWRLSTELLVAVLVGTGLGYGLDKLFKTAPWLMLVGVGLGFAAGIKGVLRVSDEMNKKTAHIPIGKDLVDDTDDNMDDV